MIPLTLLLYKKKKKQKIKELTYFAPRVSHCCRWEVANVVYIGDFNLFLATKKLIFQMAINN